MNAWCLHMRGSDELENKKVLPSLRLPAAFPGHTIPLSCFRCHRVVPIRSNGERKKWGGKKKEKKIEKFILRFYHSCEPSHKSAFIALVPREHGTTRRSRLKRSISKATFHRYLSLTQPPTFRVRGYTMLAKHGDRDRETENIRQRISIHFHSFPLFFFSTPLSFSISFHNSTTWRGYIRVYFYGKWKQTRGLYDDEIRKSRYQVFRNAINTMMQRLHSDVRALARSYH